MWGFKLVGTNRHGANCPLYRYATRLSQSRVPP
jgi:hypothetical protein